MNSNKDFSPEGNIMFQTVVMFNPEALITDITNQNRITLAGLYPKWHPIPYVVHNGPWSKVVHYIGNRALV